MEAETIAALIDIGLNIFYIFIGKVIALFYENLGASQLKIYPDITTDSVKDNRLRTRFLHLKVTNQPRKNWPLVSRQTAYSCHGTISFLTLDRKPIIDKYKNRLR